VGQARRANGKDRLRIVTKGDRARYYLRGEGIEKRRTAKESLLAFWVGSLRKEDFSRAKNRDQTADDAETVS